MDKGRVKTKINGKEDGKLEKKLLADGIGEFNGFRTKM